MFPVDLLCTKTQPPFLFTSGLLQMIVNLCAALTNSKSAHAQTRTANIFRHPTFVSTEHNIPLWLVHTFTCGTHALSGVGHTLATQC